MNFFPFQNVFRADGIELGLDDAGFNGVRPAELVSAQCGADEEVAFISLLQRGLSRAIEDHKTGYPDENRTPRTYNAQKRGQHIFNQPSFSSREMISWQVHK